ncbi:MULTISPECIES: hypothetical protein [Streptomyces]|uniref:hypothetical protein n=1 Tax=Streptomyces TaxID=1883 RepID=UPI0018ACA4BC|nr:hypothetical protein [Streptomyces sp. BRB081]MBL3805242.1 hypothetical protein [Streptomyces sp. BRB081]
MTATTHEAVRDAVRDAGRALGLPDPVTEGFARLLRPCVHLCPYEALPEELRKDARPAARVGGPARIPQGVDVPDYVPHVLTLDCAALPTGVLDVDFPTEGHVAVLTESTDDGGFFLHVPTGTETVERHRPERDDDQTRRGPFPLYAVPGTTCPRWLDRSHVAEAADYAEGDEGRAGLVDRLIEQVESLVDVGWGHDVQLGGHSPAWHDPLEDRGDVLLVAVPWGTVSGDDLITYISGTPEEIAERRYDDLAFTLES